MPTTPVASGPANANAYREAPSSASETVGITVVTASDSNATMKISATMLQVVVRSSRQSLIGRARRARGTPSRSRSGRRRRRARSAIHRCSESAPRFLPTTRCASPPGARRREPVQQHRVQRDLADADRRVGPDRGEAHVVGHLVGPHGAHVRRAEAFGVATRQVERPLVDVDRPDPRGGRRQRQRERDRPPPAAEVEQVPGGRRRGDVVEEHPRAEVDVVRGEDAAGGLDLDLAAGQVHAQEPALVGGGRLRREVVVLLAHGADDTHAAPPLGPQRNTSARVGDPVRPWSARQTRRGTA